MSEDRTFIMNATKDAQLQDHFVLWIDSNQAYALMRLLLNRIENNEDKFSISFMGEVELRHDDAMASRITDAQASLLTVIADAPVALPNNTFLDGSVFHQLTKMTPPLAEVAMHKDGGPALMAITEDGKRVLAQYRGHNGGAK